MADDERQPVASSAADALALHAHGALDPRAADYLEKQGRLADEQTRLARLQSENLVEQNAYELSHLRFRRFSDWTRFSLEAAGFLLVLLVMCAIGAMVWNAAQDRDLVVEPFSVPNDVAQTGLTGSVLAGRVIDRVGQMQADTYSVAQGIGTYKSISADAVRIQIPETGISIGEFDSYLRQWLGHESVVTGALVHAAKGYTATIRYADQTGGTVESADLDSLTTKAAEQLYHAARPLRYADYLTSHGRFDEALRIILPLARDGSARERASAYVSWATLLYQQGDPRGQMEKGAIATELDPSNAGGWYELDGGAYNVQHREVAIKAEKTVIALIKQGKAGDVAPDLAAKVLTGLHADLAIDMADPAGAIAQCQLVPDVVALDCSTGFMIGYELTDHDIGEARRLAALLPATEGNAKPSAGPLTARAGIAESMEDWPAATASLKRIIAIYASRPADMWRLTTQGWPNLAHDMAKAGDIAGAKAVIAKTPLDCDQCVDTRGAIADAEGNWPQAEHWYAMVSARAPSLPYYPFHWGRMLLHKGDLDGAIAKFKQANDKGPHFADPLEMWGEALVAKNRSDLALAKFEEAAKYAPNWGRLHLEWGEALSYSGDHAGAEKQFLIAASLGLSPAEARAVEHWIKHG